MKYLGKTLLVAALFAAPVAQAQVLGGRAVGGVVAGVAGSAGGAVSGAMGAAGSIGGIAGASGSGQGTGMFGATFGQGGIGSTISSASGNAQGIGGGRAWGTFDETPRGGNRNKTFAERFSKVSDGVNLGRTISIGESRPPVTARGTGEAQARAPGANASANAKTDNAAARREVRSSNTARSSVETRRVRANAVGDAQVQANR